MARSSASFKPGESGNPGGRPKVVAEVRELARQHTAAAIETLASIMNDREEHARARVAAANALLDRGYGRPPQDISVDARMQWQGEDIVAVHAAAPAVPR